MAQRPELRTIVVFTEGSNSEPDYVNGLRRLPHIRGDVSLRLEIHPEHRVPLTLARMAISNPCFELWLILHHQDHHKFGHTAAVEGLSRSLDGRPGKSVDASRYLPRRQEAVRRAHLLAKRHEREGNQFPHDNPSSGMYLFLQSLEDGT